LIANFYFGRLVPLLNAIGHKGVSLIAPVGGDLIMFFMKREFMNNQHYRLFFSLYLLIAFPINATDTLLVKTLNSVISNCHDKTTEQLISQLESLEHDLYQHVQALKKHSQDLLFRPSRENELLSVYILFGAPYIPEHYLIGKMAASCHVYYRELKESFKAVDTQEAKQSMSYWKACVWDIHRENHPLADQFQFCVQSVPFIEAARKR